MNSLCQHCGFDIHIDDTQVPPYAFTVDCPRCRKSVTMSPPPKPEPTLKGDQTHAIGAPIAPKSTLSTSSPNNPTDMMNAFMQMMAATMVGGGAGPAKSDSLLQKSFAWARKHVLVCSSDGAQRQMIENAFEAARYEVTVAQTSSQAIETMHDFKIDIILLDPQFDTTRQGGIAVLRHVSSLMPKYRRKVYIVLVSPQVKTLDTYMAFLNCVNLTVNSEDLESLPAILEKSIKDYNDLYRPLHEAGNMSAF